MNSKHSNWMVSLNGMNGNVMFATPFGLSMVYVIGQHHVYTFTSYTMTVMAQLSIAKEIFIAELADIVNLLHMHYNMVYQQHCTSILDHIIAFITLCTYVQQGYVFGCIGLCIYVVKN